MMTNTNLSSPCFDHKFSGQMCGWLRFKWTNGDTLIQGITRNDLSINRRKIANNYNKRSHLKEFLRRRNNTTVKLDFHRRFNKSRLDRRLLRFYLKLKRWLDVVNKEYHRQSNRRKRYRYRYRYRYLESRNCISELLDFKFYWGAFPSLVGKTRPLFWPQLPIWQSTAALGKRFRDPTNEQVAVALSFISLLISETFKWRWSLLSGSLRNRRLMSQARRTRISLETRQERGGYPSCQLTFTKSNF